ncbi:MAG TPA: hypothetical protein VJT82_01495, partial [Pyrinomonadaceae bacterium]|nr:hypothetical protein [Pyrinomonadaceae bacterium]
MPIETANYVDANRNARPANGQTRRRPSARPRMPSSVGFMLTAVVIAVAIFFGLWWILVANGDDSPWLPAVL